MGELEADVTIAANGGLGTLVEEDRLTTRAAGVGDGEFNVVTGLLPATIRAVLTIVVLEPEVEPCCTMGRMAMTFLPPAPVMKTNCFPVACNEAAKAGGTIICRRIGLFPAGLLSSTLIWELESRKLVELDSCTTEDEPAASRSGPECE